MNQTEFIPAIDGWYTMDKDRPHLLGSQCTECATFYFPKQNQFCQNPNCENTQFNDVKLSRRGKIWSYTNAAYCPPTPYVASDPYQPFCIAAVELDKEKMIVLGQVAQGINAEQLEVGQPVELILEALHMESGSPKLIWKWKPVNDNNNSGVETHVE